MKSDRPLVTLRELGTLMDAPAVPAFNLYTASALHELSDDDLCEIAREGSDDPVRAISDLIEGMRVQYANDRVTLAALAGIQYCHLPNALDLAREG